MRISFRFRLIPFIASVLIAVLGLNLGIWQTRRAEEKTRLAQQIEQSARQPARDWTASAQALPPVFSKQRLRGEFIADWPLYLDNRPMQGVAGRYVLMPFRLENSQQYLLVARGWIARDPRDRVKLPPLLTPVGQLQIEGVVRTQLDRVMQLGAAELPQRGAILQNLELAALEKQSGFHFTPLIIEQTSALADGLRRDWPQPSAGIEKHRAYAFQWYALSLMACAFFIISGIRREQRTATKN